MYCFIHSVSSSDAGAIVGGTVGGLAAVAIVAVVAIGGVVVLKKSKMKSKSNHKCAHVYVAVPGRNRTSFCCVFFSHRSTLAWKGGAHTHCVNVVSIHEFTQYV